MLNFLERAARSIFFTIGNSSLLCTVCEHTFLNHVRLSINEWVVRDVPCRVCDCLGFKTIDQDVHGG